MQYNAMQCNAMQCNTMQCNAMQCNAMQCNAMQCNAMQGFWYVCSIKNIVCRDMYISAKKQLFFNPVEFP